MDKQPSEPSEKEVENLEITDQHSKDVSGGDGTIFVGRKSVKSASTAAKNEITQILNAG